MKRIATAIWRGGPRAGEGVVSTASGVFNNVIYTFGTTAIDVPCTNPSEMLAAAAASCTSMILAKELEIEGIVSEHIATQAELVITQDKEGWTISSIHLGVKVHMDPANEEVFQKAVQRARQHCPITKSLKAKVTLEAAIEPVMAAVAD